MCTIFALRLTLNKFTKRNKKSTFSGCHLVYCKIQGKTSRPLNNLVSSASNYYCFSMNFFEHVCLKVKNSLTYSRASYSDVFFTFGFA